MMMIKTFFFISLYKTRIILFLFLLFFSSSSSSFLKERERKGCNQRKRERKKRIHSFLPLFHVHISMEILVFLFVLSSQLLPFSLSLLLLLLPFEEFSSPSQSTLTFEWNLKRNNDFIRVRERERMQKIFTGSRKRNTFRNWYLFAFDPDTISLYCHWTMFVDNVRSINVH